MAFNFALSILDKFLPVFHSFKPRCSAPIPFLDLPYGARLEIYNAVSNLPIVCVMPTVRMGDDTVTRLPIPWFSLMLVCRTIAGEMQHYLLERSTYTFYIQNFRSLAECLCWQRIPCPPSGVRTLQADLMLNPFTMCWRADDDEPPPFVRDLYQIVNTFVRNGPLMTRERPLTKPIHLDTFIVKICPDVLMFLKRKVQPRDDHGWKEQIWPEMQWCISWIVNRGVLFGAVDKIVCEWADDGDRVEWEVRPPVVGDMTESGPSP
ncbi:hypothetical protein MSAN_01944100 [Mycena sanguinolenta]|uniref:Uncharacterized protein n=1 Tax=Mycena sanguinolenta TaxID=230812 RepID=A0A8H6XNM6_9AGAR|nr:hypothetical protein MSAN_01944100 [Mycena sanguinolenta]